MNEVEITKELMLSEQRLASVRDFHPDNQLGYDHAADFARRAKSECERLEAARVKITKPMREALQAVQDTFVPPIKNYAAMLALLKGRMMECQKVMLAKHDAAVLDAQQAYRQGDMQQLAVATQAITTSEVVAPQGVSTRVTWGDFEIVDSSQIPAQFWMINQAAIRLAIVQAKGQIVIPGVRVIKNEVVALRS